MRLMQIYWLAFLTFLSVINCSGALEAGTRLRFVVLSAKTDVAAPFESVDFIYGPRVKSAGHDGAWWQLEIRSQAALTNSPLCVVRGLTSADPLGEKAKSLGFARYQLRIPTTDETLEYVEAHSGQALLPPWVDFEKHFVPHAASGTRRKNGAPQTCEFMGQVLTLQSVATNEWTRWPEVKRLVLDREALIGNSRNFKDKEGRRLPQTPKKQEYTYIPFQKADYQQMLGAGMNLFTIAPEQEEYVRDEPVFYRRAAEGNPPVRFPADLYRANYLGSAMFMDEPASVLIWDNSTSGKINHFADVTELIEKRTRSMFYSGDENYGVYGLEKELGANLGDMRLAQTELPVWETKYDRAYYLMKGGGTGIIHEGRYQLQEFNDKVARLAGAGCKFTVREMLEYYYAWLRGGTRPFGKFWGTAIYGQCDPAIAPEAFSVAYDMGARYFWFWSSDHGHHVPWLEQLDLTRKFKAYMAAHPRRSIFAPPPRRDTLITIPDGWFLSLDDPVWLRGFDKEGKRGESQDYRSLQRHVLKVAQECLGRGDSLDITVDDGHRIEGYRHVKRIRE